MQAEIINASVIEYKLSSVLTIDSVENLSNLLKAHLVENDYGSGLKLDASAVEVITTPGVQMVIALGTYP